MAANDTKNIGLCALGLGAAISGMLLYSRSRAKRSSNFESPSAGRALGVVSDADWMALAHQCLQARQRTPSQSHFRVAAVITFRHKQSSDSAPDQFVVGHNGEACCLLNSCCAERAALLQLGQLDDVFVTGVYLVSDLAGPITPGALCREFMLSSELCSPQTRVLMEGSEGAQTQVERTLDQLWPFASAYTRLASEQQLAFGRKFAKGVQSMPDNQLWVEAIRLAREVCLKDDREGLHPMKFGASIVWPSGHHAVASQVKALEYGCTMDPICQLAAAMQAHGDACGWDESSMSGAVLVMTDQFGVCHGPFAPARAFLAEHGWGQVKVLLHNQNGKLESHSVEELMPMLPAVKLCGC